mgnify:CR=1 FL=1
MQGQGGGGGEAGDHSFVEVGVEHRGCADPQPHAQGGGGCLKLDEPDRSGTGRFFDPEVPVEV